MPGERSARHKVKQDAQEAPQKWIEGERSMQLKDQSIISRSVTQAMDVYGNVCPRERLLRNANAGTR